MTHMDNQIAKHIKNVIRRAMRKAPIKHEPPPTLPPPKQIITTIRRGPDRVHGLMPPRSFPLRDEDAPA